jgi:sugar phosphate isomerase/epimerase
MRKFGLQLYTVREAISKDLRGTLKQVADIGYRALEIQPSLGGIGAKALRRELDMFGLNAVTSYVGMDLVMGERDALAAEFANIVELGSRYTGVAWIGEPYRTPEGLKRATEAFNNAAELAAEHGLGFVYHAHAFEFEIDIDGQHLLDVLLAWTDADLVKWQLDTYWVQKGGEDILSYMSRYRRRIPILHIKDMTSDAAETFEIVGAGKIDFDAIFKMSDSLGVDWYIVEQDICPQGEIASARASYDNLGARGWMQ